MVEEKTLKVEIKSGIEEKAKEWRDKSTGYLSGAA